MHNTSPGSDAEPDDMRAHPANLTRHQAEQLVRDGPAGTGELDRLLAAARTTGARADTAGLNQALADLSNRDTLPAAAMPAPRKRSLLRVAITRLAAAKMLIIVALAVLATGGIALAATTGAFPNPLRDSPHATTPASPGDTSTESATDTSRFGAPSLTHAQPNSSPAGSGAASTGIAPTHTGNTGPSPSLAGLCKSWLARPHDNGKADDSAAFGALITAAGGEDAVDGYCSALVASPTSSAAPTSVTPTQTGSDATATTCGKKTHANGDVTGKC